MLRYFISAVCLFSSALAFGQQSEVQLTCSESKTAGYKKLNQINWPKNAGLNQYDVHYHKLDLALTNNSIYIEGKVSTKARVTAPQLSDFVFELHPSLSLDSVKVNGMLVSVTQNGNFKECSLGASLPQNAQFIAEIWYHGTPTAVGGAAIGSGISTAQSPSWGNRVTWTLSEPYSAYEWWPCKQSLSDKIDSVDVWITVGDSLKAGSNGLLRNITPISGNRLRYEWAHRYPIDYYLISASVAKYVDYSFYAYPNGNQDSVLIQNYIYDNPATLTNFLADINQTKDFMEGFAGLFGTYPFENEKYGHCMAPFGGGMEHQTMTTQGNFNFTLTAHELAHQWFGNKVTCGSWKDIWVNEGFASYAEYLAYELINPNQARPHMNSFHDQAMSEPGGSIYVDDTSNVGRIFSSRLSYKKGAALVHMIRYLVNDDAVFFQGIRDYLATYAYATAYGTDFKSSMENTSGISLTNLFDDYYFGEGYPTFSLRYKKSSNGRVYLKLLQTASMPSVTPLFRIPVEIKLLSAGGDTTIKMTSDAPEVLFDFEYSRNVSTAQIDPNQWILNQSGSVLQDNTLSIENEWENQSASIFPNPATDIVQLKNFTIGEPVSIYEASGKLVQTIQIKSTIETVQIKTLAAGVYQIKSKNRSFKLIKQH